MDNDEVLRQEAVRLSLQGLSVQEIATRFEKSRQWVYKWIHKYQTSEIQDWYVSVSNAPKEISNKVSAELESTVVEIRKCLSGNPYSQRGAISILYEFEDRKSVV